MNIDVLLSAVGHGHSAYDTPESSHPHLAYDAPIPLQYRHDSGESTFNRGQGQPQCQDATNYQDQDQDGEQQELGNALPPAPSANEAKDPDAEDIRFDCRDVDDLETNLAGYLSAPTAPAEHAIIEFHFPVTAAFMVYIRDFKRDARTAWTAADASDLVRRTAVSVVEVLQDTTNPKDQIIRQKAVARTIVEAVQRADGFRYSFHNNWLSREDRAHRFSFVCNDSTLNKGRAANGGAGSERRERRKPVYDCKGLVAVKFSVIKNNLEVHYRHVPLHKTFEERAPPPRRESKRRRLLEVLDLRAIERLPKKQKKGEGAPENKQDGIKFAPYEKTGSPRFKNSLPRPANFSSNVQRQQPTDEGLQPLIDFLGSAERQTPVGGVSPPNQGANSDDDRNDSGVVAVDDDDAPAEDADTEHGTTNAPSANSREKVPKVQNHQPARKRPTIHGPMSPGQIEGSSQAGYITSGLDTPASHYLKQVEEESKMREEEEDGKKKLREQAKAAKKGKKNQPLTGLGSAASAPLSELELLRQQLAATQERLERLESENRQHPPYPPYPQPHQDGQYPYPPPPQGYYPPPPPNHPPHLPSNQPYMVSRQPGSFHHYQPPVAPAGPPMYPGGPLHPNINTMAPKFEMTQTIAQTSTPPGQSGLAPSKPDTHAQNGEDDHPESPTEKVVQSQPSAADKHNADEAYTENPARAGSAPAVITDAGAELDTAAQTEEGVGDSHELQAQNSATCAASKPPPQARPASTLGQAMVQPSTSSIPATSLVATSRQPTKGVLKVLSAAENPTFHVHINTSFSSKRRSQQPLGGVLKLVDVPNTPAACTDFQQSEDARMKGFFDSALAAIDTATSAGLSSAGQNQPSVWTGPAYAPRCGLGWSPGNNNPPPAPQSYAYTPPHYPYSYPYPPSQYPCGYGPLPSSSYSYQPPPSEGRNRGYQLTHPPPSAKLVTPASKSGERPPPGYDDPRAQMVAYAQASPTPASKAKDKIIDGIEAKGKEREADSSTAAANTDTGTAPTKLAISETLRVDQHVKREEEEKEGGKDQPQARSAIFVSSSGSTDELVQTASEQTGEAEKDGDNRTTSREA